MSDFSEDIADRVQMATASGEKLHISAGHSKGFYGNTMTTGTHRLSLMEHKGIVEYEPSELVLTARSGTTLLEIEQALDEAGQRLAFEPPHFGEQATLGGAIATGLSGPIRAFPNVGGGAARDMVLGTRVINGQGQIVRFGGQVMKNVAGYDVSRLMTGSMGTLGVLLEVSLKVLPKPEVERSLAFEMDASDALIQASAWANKPYPISGLIHEGGMMVVRLSGSEAAVNRTAQHLGGDELSESDGFWLAIREQQHPFFAGTWQEDRNLALWRLSLPPFTDDLELKGDVMIDWGGAQRWMLSSESAEHIRQRVSAAGGHATRFRGGDKRIPCFHPLQPGIAQLHKRVKAAMDPKGIFNPGRLYPDL